jgi:predicted transcriptional regulator
MVVPLGPGLDTLCSLMFELSNQDRLRILNRLRRGPSNVTGVSEDLGLSTQETSRQLSRLARVGLTRKDTEALHHITSYAELVLEQLPGLDFASEHTDYFNGHSVTGLPSKFVGRLGDLVKAERIEEIMAGLHSVDRMIQRAEEYVWSVTDQYLVSTTVPLREALERGVSVRNLEGKYCVPPQADDSWYGGLEDRALQRARGKGLLEERILEHVEVYLYMSEREVGALAFPLHDGRFDYLGFASEDESTRMWCEDLFEHYWERAEDRVGFFEEIKRWLVTNPRAIGALRAIGEGKKTPAADEMVSEFETRGVMRGGKLTILGIMAYASIMERPRARDD